MNSFFAFLVGLIITLAPSAANRNQNSNTESQKTIDASTKEISMNKTKEATPTLDPSPTIKVTQAIKLPTKKPIATSMPTAESRQSDSQKQNTNTNIDINVISPQESQVYKANDTINVQFEFPNTKPTKTELYIGSGSLLKTYTSGPYTYELHLQDYAHGLTGNIGIPIEVKAYHSNGAMFYKMIDIHIVPANAQVPSVYPTIQKPISIITSDFYLIDGTKKSGIGNFTFEIEQYDSFEGYSRFHVSGSVHQLKSNADYELFAIIKNGHYSITKLRTDGSGSASFNNSWSSKFPYCDLYQIAVREAGVDYDHADYWSQEVNSVCPKG